MSIEKSMKQFELDRRESVKIAARLLLASGTTSFRVWGVGECTTISLTAIPRKVKEMFENGEGKIYKLEDY